MKVICTGMPKTGTKTLASALRTLGYNVYDLEEQSYFLGKDLINAVESGWSTEDIRRIYKNVDAVTDIMASCLWEEIFRAFPDAKIVHTERKTEEEWSKSFFNQMDAARRHFSARIVANVTPTGRRFKHFLDASLRIAAFSPYPGIFGVPEINRPLAQIRYREHNTHVKQVVPKDQLLLFNLSDGWEPLCEFLSKPVPKKPFPHKNKGATLSQDLMDTSLLFKRLKQEFLVVLCVFIFGVALLLYYVVMEISV